MVEVSQLKPPQGPKEFRPWHKPWEQAHMEMAAALRQLGEEELSEYHHHSLA